MPPSALLVRARYGFGPADASRSITGRTSPGFLRRGGGGSCLAQSATNVANGFTLLRTLASSSALMYSSRRSTGMMVQGTPADANMAFMMNRPVRPLPSGNGRMNVKMKCCQAVLSAMFAANDIWSAGEAARLTQLAEEYSSLAGLGIISDAA